MDKMRGRVLLSCLCILVAYSIFIIFGFGVRLRFEFPLELYWLCFVFALLPLLLDLVFWDGAHRLRIFCLLSFSLLIHLQYVLLDSSPFLASVDAIADYRLTDTIIANSHWSRNWVFGFGSEYQFYPVTNFLYATISMVTGISLLLVVKYLFLIRALFVPLMLEKWFSSFFDHRIAYLGTVLFLSSPGAILFPHKESFATIFFFLAIFSITKMVKTRKYLLLGSISIVTLSMTHHFTTYIFLGIITSLFLGSYVFKQQKIVRVSTQFFLLCWAIFGFWATFIALEIIRHHQELLFTFMLPGQAIFSEVMPLYASHERVIIALAYGVTVISAGLGFLSYVKNKKERSPTFLSVASFFLPVIVFAFIFRFSTSSFNVLASHRILEFGYILLGVSSAFFFFRAIRSRKGLAQKGIVICAIVLMAINGPMSGAMYPPTFDRLRDVLSFRAISLSTWMNQTGAKEQNTIGDRIVYLILTGYGDSKVVQYPELFAGQSISLPPDIRSKSPSYVVTYLSMIDFYGLDATKFANSPYFHSIYTNGIIDAYSISNRTSS